jgi:hypothetical protein
MVTSDWLTITGQHHPRPAPEGELCGCLGVEPFCEECDGVGRVYPEVDYDDDSTITVGGERVRLVDSLRVRPHSPTGFSWGYMGSGPAQTALAILLKVTGDPDEALRFYQAFKEDVVRRLPMGEPFEFRLNYDQWKWWLRRERDAERGTAESGILISTPA